MGLLANHRRFCLSFMICFLFLIVDVARSQDCSATNLCKTGCCSSSGYCGTDSAHCDPSVCVSTCDYTPTNQCDANNLCSEGCCSRYGVCGYGPDFCSPDNCVSTCDVKSECDPDDWGTAYANSTNCPLNVCCSKYGFCGTTTEFCGTKTVKRPSCEAITGRLSRVVGYYEGWARTRACNVVWPEQIPLGVYTHLNFAFASIDPTNFQVVPAYQSDIALYTRLTALKNQDPDLRVNIAIGGWSFNDPGPTATTFSDLAASEDNQRAFFKSLISFMATYGFDGVDIDWEYPAADDRSGRAEDYANLPTFMANLKDALKSTGGRDELSITLPASYWYLQHFDIEKLSSIVDYFNYMSYDLHGTWDKGNKWTGAFLDSHTNLTEIEPDLDLLWRNNVPPQKVNLGLAFYGRSFTLADTSCSSPGCMFSSGGNPGNCSGTTGILMNSEIDSIISANNLRSTLDSTSAVEVLTWDDQWTTYDDSKTLGLKTQFARSSCLGGVMVWAVSHDNVNGSYSRDLSSGTNRPFTSYVLSTDSGLDPYVSVATQHPQCQWTGCGETCPSGYVAVSRTDSGARKGELMLDGTACPKGTVHTFCCPSNKLLPYCGWYTFNNGRCNSECPLSMVEVGSNSQYCNNDDYQAACCTLNVASTWLYGTIQWSEAPSCDDGTCPYTDGSGLDTTLTSSTTGSGGAKCNPRDRSKFYGPWDYSSRQLCANVSSSDARFDSCKWHDNLGPSSDGKGSWCASSCPSGQVRVAMDQYADHCQNDGGAMSFCCDANYNTYTQEYNSDIQNFEDYLTAFLADPICTFDNSTNITDANKKRSDDSQLLPRATTPSKTDMVTFLSLTLVKLMKDTVYTQEESVEQAYWDSQVTKNYTNLTIASLQSYANNNEYFYACGPQAAAENILCRMSAYNSLVKVIVPPPCFGDVCADDVEPDLCEEDDDSSGDDDDDETLEFVSNVRRDDAYFHTFDKRSVPHPYQVWCAGSGVPVTGLYYSNAAYPPQGQWTSNTPQYQNARYLVDEDDCGNPIIIPRVKQSNNYNTEHIVEIQLIGQFFEDATRGSLVSGRTPRFVPVDCGAFTNTQGGTNFMYSKVLATPGQPKKAKKIPLKVIMAALGNNKDLANFYLLQAEINGMKARVFGNKALVESTKMASYIADTAAPGNALKLIRDAIAVWSYMNDPDVASSTIKIANNVRAQLVIIDSAYYQQIGYPLGLTDAWDEWFPDMVAYQVSRSRTWIVSQLTSMLAVWFARIVDPNYWTVMGTLWSLSSYTDLIQFSTSGLD